MPEQPPEPKPKAASSRVHPEEHPAKRSSVSNGWGGRRPGAGAPKGNLNGLKHGMRSKQVAQLGALVNASPRTTAVLIKLAARQGRQSQTAEQTLAAIITAVIKRADKLSGGKLLNDQSTRAFNELLGSLGLDPQ